MLYVRVCVCSQVQEHGDGRGVAGLLQAGLPRPPGGGAEGWLAEEAAQHHEELAAPLVRAALRPALLLQRRGGNQTTGNTSAKLAQYSFKKGYLASLTNIFICPPLLCKYTDVFFTGLNI